MKSINSSKLEDTSGSCGSLIRASWFHLVVLVAPPDEGLTILESDRSLSIDSDRTLSIDSV